MVFLILHFVNIEPNRLLSLYLLKCSTSTILSQKALVLIQQRKSFDGKGLREIYKMLYIRFDSER